MSKTPHDSSLSIGAKSQDGKIIDDISVYQENSQLKEQLSQLVTLLKLNQVHANNKFMIAEQSQRLCNQYQDMQEQIQNNNETIEKLKQQYQVECDEIKQLKDECLMCKHYDITDEETLQQYLAELSYVQDKNESYLNLMEKTAQNEETKHE